MDLNPATRSNGLATGTVTRTIRRSLAPRATSRRASSRWRTRATSTTTRCKCRGPSAPATAGRPGCRTRCRAAAATRATGRREVTRLAVARRLRSGQRSRADQRRSSAHPDAVRLLRRAAHGGLSSAPFTAPAAGRLFARRHDLRCRPQRLHRERVSAGRQLSQALAAKMPFDVDYNGGRNGARGPNYQRLDFRAGYRIRLAGGRTIDAFLDIFNVTNEPNFANPTNITNPATLADQRLPATFMSCWPRWTRVRRGPRRSICGSGSRRARSASTAAGESPPIGGSPRLADCHVLAGAPGAPVPRAPTARP